MAVRLSSNESPFGPSPAVIDVLQDLAGSAHRYPDDQSAELRRALAAHEEVDLERVAAGNGSAGLLMDLVAEAVRAGEDADAEVLTYERAFIVYKLAAQVVGARLVEAPVGDAYRRDPEALLERISASTRIVLVDNPANPTGAHVDGEALTHLVSSIPDNITVVVDEAYHDFAAGQDGYATVAELGLEHPRLVVVRTFSKAYALAGLRVGYLVGPQPLVADVDAARVRFNVNAAGQVAAIAALRDREHLAATVAGTLAGRARMIEGLEELGVEHVSGLGNFVLLELGEPATAIVERYARHGVGVRPLQPYRLDEQVRVTVGTPHEVEAFLDATRAVFGSRS